MSVALAAGLMPAAVSVVVLALLLVAAIAVRARLQDELPIVPAEEPLLAPPRMPAVQRREPVLAVAGLHAAASDSIAFNLAVLTAISGELNGERGRRRPRPACILPDRTLSRRLGVDAGPLAAYLGVHPYRLAPEVVSCSTWHPSGCELFAIQQGDRSVEYLKLLVPALRRLYDLVIVACDVDDHYLADSAAEVADTFILVGSALQGAGADAGSWLERVWSLGLEQKSALIVTDEPAGRDALSDVAGQFLYRTQLPNEPATALLDARAIPWALDRRLASTRQLETAVRQLLPSHFAGGEAHAA